jgi:aminopeptidase N
LIAAAGLASSVAAASQAQDQRGEVHDPHAGDECHEGCGKSQLARMRHAMGLPPAAAFPPLIAFGDRSALSDTDVLHNKVQLEAFATTQSITGTSTITVKSLVDGLSTFTFVLNNTFTVGSVLVSGNAVPAPASVGTWGKLVTLDRVYNNGETFTVTIPYSGSAHSSLGFGSVFWDTQGGLPVISSLSQPYFAATWWPCKDGDFGAPGDNSDKATWEIEITHADELTGVSNGTRQSVTPLGNGKSVTRWVSA